MKLNELISTFEIYKTNEEKDMLHRLSRPIHLSSFNEHERFVIEGLIRKSLVTKIGMENPQVISNDIN